MIHSFMYLSSDESVSNFAVGGRDRFVLLSAADPTGWLVILLLPNVEDDVSTISTSW